MGKAQYFSLNVKLGLKALHQ